MKILRVILVFLLAVLCAPLARAGNDRVSTHFTPDDSDAPSFEMAAETAYMLGVIGNPNSYEIGAQFVTARWRFGPVYREGFFRGYNQFYVLAMVEPIFRGPENFYYGISVGLRYNFLHPGSRFTPYVSGGVGLGWIDSHANINRRAGAGLHFQLPRRRRRFLQNQRSVESDGWASSTSIFPTADKPIQTRASICSGPRSA